MSYCIPSQTPIANVLLDAFPLFVSLLPSLTFMSRRQTNHQGQTRHTSHSIPSRAPTGNHSLPSPSLFSSSFPYVLVVPKLNIKTREDAGSLFFASVSR